MNIKYLEKRILHYQRIAASKDYNYTVRNMARDILNDLEHVKRGYEHGKEKEICTNS